MIFREYGCSEKIFNNLTTYRSYDQNIQVMIYPKIAKVARK